jgi:hypothetical protein
MNCPGPERLSIFLDEGAADGELPEHLASCGSCRARLRTLRALKAAAARAVVVPPMPADLAEKLLEMGPREPEPWPWRRALGGWIWRPSAVVSMGLAAFAAAIWAFHRGEAEVLPLETLLAAHDQYALTMPLASAEAIVARMPSGAVEEERDAD